MTSARLVRNTLVNGLAKSSSALVTALLLPFLLNRLGAEEYGIWLLALGLTFTNGYLALADLGLADAAVKFVAEARAMNVPRMISEIASTTAAFFTLVGVIVAGMMALLAPTLTDFFGIRPQLADAARTVFLLMALEVMLSLPSAAFRAVIEGAQRYTLVSGIDLVSRLAWAVLAVVAVLRGHGMLALAVTSLIVTSAKALATIVGAFRSQEDLQVLPSMVRRTTLRRTLSYGSFVGGLRVLSVVYGQMDRAIIGAVLTVAAVSQYEIAFRINSLAALAMAIAPSAVLPAAAYNAARGDLERQRVLYVRGTKYTMALVLPITIAAMLYAEPIIATWIGPEYRSLAGPSRLFLVLSLFACTNQLGVTMLIGLGRAKQVLWMQLTSVLFNLLLSVALAPSLGISGVIVGTLVGQGIVWAPSVRLMLNTFSVDIRTWSRQIVLPNVPGAVVQIVVGVTTYRWTDDLGSLALVGAVCFFSVASNVGIFGAIGLDRHERSLLFSRFGWPAGAIRRRTA